LKIRADEHVSPAIVKAIREIALKPGWEISSILDANHRGFSDVHWITAFAKNGGNVILTADTDFLKLEPQVNAVFDIGVRVIHLPKRWAQARSELQAAHILQWWSRIETAIIGMKPRECFQPEWNISEQGTLKKVKINFASAQRARRKKKRRK